MKGILIDTTGAQLEIAYVDGDKTDYIIKSGLRHSLTLIPALKELLERNNVTVDGLNVIGAVTGPGSFTGIRIGLSTVKALSYACKIPVFGVNSMRVRAYNVYNSGGTFCGGNEVTAVRDAANGFAYVGVYEGKSELLPPSCLNLSQLAVFLGSLDKDAVVTGYPFSEDPCEKGLIRALKESLDSGGFVKESELEPIYIRKPQAEENLK